MSFNDVITAVLSHDFSMDFRGADADTGEPVLVSIYGVPGRGMMIRTSFPSKSKRAVAETKAKAKKSTVASTKKAPTKPKRCLKFLEDKAPAPAPAPAPTKTKKAALPSILSGYEDVFFNDDDKSEHSYSIFDEEIEAVTDKLNDTDLAEASDDSSACDYVGSEGLSQESFGLRRSTRGHP